MKHIPIVAGILACACVSGCATCRDGDAALQAAQTPDRVQDVLVPTGASPSPPRTQLQHVGDSITHGVRGTAAWIDRFLSNERSVAEENRSWISFRLDSGVEKDSDFDVAFRPSARLVLPRTEERVHLLFGREADVSIDPKLRPIEAESRSDDEANRFVAALQLVVEETERNDIRGDLGVRFHGASPDPYVSARWRHSLALASWLVSATERVRAYVDAGLESRTNFDLDHGISDAWLFRASTSGLWREEEPGYEYGETFTLFERVGERTVLAYESETSFDTDATHAVSETALRFRWSRRFEENRLRIEIAPQLAWRDESDYRPIAGLFVRIELTFGRD